MVGTTVVSELFNSKETQTHMRYTGNCILCCECLPGGNVMLSLNYHSLRVGVEARTFPRRCLPTLIRAGKM